MNHERIRRFNTRDTYPEQDLDNDLCQAVVVRDGEHREVEATAVIAA
jgi:hypothetical protein